MPAYVLKVLVEFEARDDLEARQRAAAMIGTPVSKMAEVRDIVLHAQADRKSIHMNPDGTFVGQWNKGGK